MIHGYLDHASRHHISGWAIDEAQPGTPVHVTISDHGNPLIRVLANRHRADVAATRDVALCGFDVSLPGLSPLHRHVISARVDGQDHDLMNSPLIIEPSQAFDSETEAALTRVIAAADASTLDRAAVALAEAIEAILARRAALQSHEALRHFRYRFAKHRACDTPSGPARGDPPRSALVIDTTMPRLEAGRDVITTAHHALTLRRLGYDVAFVAADLARPDGHLAQAMRHAGVTVHHAPFTASVEEVLRRSGATFDVVMAFGVASVNRYGQLVRAYGPKATLVYCRTLGHDQADGPSPEGFMAALAAQARAEDAAVRLADVIATPDATDAERLAMAYPDARVHVVPWTAPVRPTLVPVEQRAGVVFLGGREALRPLIATIMADIADLDPTIEEVTASDPVAPSLASDPAVFDRVRLAIILGSEPADRQRALECFAAGVPCIAPGEILAAIGADADLQICDTADVRSLVRRIVDLHQDGAFAQLIRKRGLDLVDFDRTPAEADAAMRQLLSKRRPASVPGRRTVSTPAQRLRQHRVQCKAHGLVDALV